MRYLEFQLVLGDAPVGMIIDEIREMGVPAFEESSDSEESVSKQDQGGSIWHEGVVHHLSKETYVWNYSLVYKDGNFDVIKWKTSSAWKAQKEEDEQEFIMNKALFIGADGGVFFIKIDEEIFDNFDKLADMMDVFIQKTKGDAPFLVYGVLPNKEAIVNLKSNREMMKHLADVKKWTVQHGGEFKLENLTEIQMNLTYLVNEYAHYILTHLKKYPYSNLSLGEVHYLDYEDLEALEEIEEALAEQLKAGQTVDNLLSELIFKFLKTPEFQAEAYEAPEEEEVEEAEVIEEEEVKPPPSKIKVILEEIRKGIRRQCPKCFNNDRNKIREVVDRDNIIYDYGTDVIYGMKFICGNCGAEWRTEKDWNIKETQE